jgi:hypothetical protein
MIRSLLVRVLLLGALFAITTPGQDEARLLGAFDKAFAPPPKGKATLADKLAALQAIADLDSGKAAEQLVEGWGHVDAELAQVDARRAAITAEMKELVKGQESSETRTLPTPQHERFNQLKAEVDKIREQADGLRELQLKVGERIASLRRRDSVLWLLGKVIGNKKHALPLKLSAAKAVGGAAGEVLEELAAALPRAKEPAEQIVLLDAMALAGKVAQAHATPVIALLDSKEEAVAERAALALAKLAVPAAIGPMITLLGRSSGQSRLRIAAALEVLTEQQFGSNVGAWQAWWQAEGATVAAGGKPLGGGTPSHRKETDKNYYFGIPQDQSNAILYVIDCSGSMKAPVELPGQGTTAGGKPAVTSRLEACKKELILALSKLRPDQKFAILWYNDLPHFWESKMQLASKDAVLRAQQFVTTLKPASSTNIHDSLEQGFKLVGRGASDKYYGVELDTIFLLTDGSPTRPDGKLDSTEKILVGTRAWNPLKRVTIHCIAIGRDLNEGFLRQLASENGGEFKQF